VIHNFVLVIVSRPGSARPHWDRTISTLPTEASGAGSNLFSDRLDKAQWDLSVDSFIDCPFRGLDRCLRSVNPDEDRRFRCVRIAQRRSRQLSSRKTSESGRRGVGGGAFSVTGTMPTRTRTWGTASWSMSDWMSSRVTATSVRCVTGQVARPAIVHSSKTAESASPDANASARLWPSVESSRILAWSSGISARLSG